MHSISDDGAATYEDMLLHKEPSDYCVYVVKSVMRKKVI